MGLDDVLDAVFTSKILMLLFEMDFDARPTGKGLIQGLDIIASQAIRGPTHSRFVFNVGFGCHHNLVGHHEHGIKTNAKPADDFAGITVLGAFFGHVFQKFF